MSEEEIPIITDDKLIYARSVHDMARFPDGVRNTDACVLARYILKLESRIEKLENPEERVAEQPAPDLVRFYSRYRIPKNAMRPNLMRDIIDIMGVERKTISLITEELMKLPVYSNEKWGAIRPAVHVEMGRGVDNLIFDKFVLRKKSLEKGPTMVYWLESL